VSIYHVTVIYDRSSCTVFLLVCRRQTIRPSSAEYSRRSKREDTQSVEDVVHNTAAAYVFCHLPAAAAAAAAFSLSNTGVLV